MANSDIRKVLGEIKSDAEQKRGKPLPPPANPVTSLDYDTRVRLGPGEGLGDPNCSICHGIGVVRAKVNSVHDPNFGKTYPCICRNMEKKKVQRMFGAGREILENYRFDNFNLERPGLTEWQKHSLQHAYQATQVFVDDMKDWLLLSGGCGSGKTHLSIAIANALADKNILVMFISIPSLLDWLRASYGDAADESFDRRFNSICNAPVLVLDDLGTENATSWAQEKLFQLINHRYLSRLPTVFSTDVLTTVIEERIRSRLEDRNLVHIAPIEVPDFRASSNQRGYQPGSRVEISALHLYQDKSFGSFDPTKAAVLERKSGETGLTKAQCVQNARKMLEVAQQYAYKLEGWLVFIGGSGNGKTHLAAAIGNHAVSSGIQTIFVVAPDLLDHLRTTFNPNSAVTYDHLFEEVRRCRLLILDDLGTQSSSPWAKEKIFQLLNWRYAAKLPTVITTNVDLEDTDPRLRSRMSDEEVCRILYFLSGSYAQDQKGQKKSGPFR